MKAEKKRAGIKAQIRAEKERGRRVATAIFLAIILASASLSAYFGYTILNPSTPLNSIEPTLQFKPENPNAELKVAMVDQLSLEVPNEAFIQTAAAILTQAGYTVDYFSSEAVTVDLYRDLPARGYRLIVLRVHSALDFDETGVLTGLIGLFTSEPYSTSRYVNEQLTRRVLRATFRNKSGTYFAVSPLFIQDELDGRFANALIVVMGCNGLTFPSMAQAFVERGAETCIGWNWSVSASHTDQATAQLLRHLFNESQTIKQAVENTMKEVGPDQANNSTMKYYPIESGYFTIHG